MKLYRTMKIDPADGKPLVGDKRSMLGVRPTDPNNTNPRRKFDVDAVTGTDPVPAKVRQGLSVYVSSETLTPEKGEAIWEIDEAAIRHALVTADDGHPHYVLEPAADVTLDEYRALLADTRDDWVRVT